jgi:hypothetical protein
MTAGTKLVLGVSIVLGMLACGADPPPSVTFTVDLNADLADVDDGARVYVLLVSGDDREPLFSWPHEQIVVGCNASDRDDSGRWVLDAGDDSFPVDLASLNAGTYTVRAIIDRDPVDGRTGWAEGNAYSSKRVVELDPSAATAIELLVEHEIPPDEFVETADIKEVVLRSDLVSDFAAEDRFLRAAVVLPPGYDGNDKLYPTVYVIPGWGASHTAVLQGEHQQQRYGVQGFGRDKVYVFLDHDMTYGVHCFANSAVVGPWGDALVRELIPEIEARCRVTPDGGARFLTGQSSGGWASLWLQLSFPDEFAGAFAASPDFVDFRAFGDGLDLYDPAADWHRSPDGGLRAGVRSPADGTVLMTVAAADQRFLVARGADQLTSFEAVFGRPGPDGGPQPLADRRTGEIDRSVVEHWKAFDLSRLVAERWNVIGPRLVGRIHIWVGDRDDYYLDEAVRLFGRRLDELGARAVVEVVPGRGHDVWSDDIRRSMHASMDRLLEEAGFESP